MSEFAKDKDVPDKNVGNMSDLISRQAAIDALRKCQTYLFDPHDPDRKISLKSAEWAIEDLPSADRWIPCSERLPEVNTRCLCTYENEEGTCIDFGLYMKRGWFVSSVTAWMPLPEPYKEGTDDTEG